MYARYSYQAQPLQIFLKQIEERNELLDCGEFITPPSLVEIRINVEKLVSEVDELEQIQKNDALKLSQMNNVSEESKSEMIHRKKLVNLCRNHIDECKRIAESIVGNEALEGRKYLQSTFS